MMHIRCQWCGWSYTMGREALVAAVASAGAARATHHVENCPKCRRALKIPLAQMKARLPPGTVLSLAEAPAPAAADAAQTESADSAAAPAADSGEAKPKAATKQAKPKTAKKAPARKKPAAKKK